MKIKENEKRDKNIDLARELKMKLNMKTTVKPVAVGVLGTIPEYMARGLEVVEIGDHPKYNIVKIGQNIEKVPGDMRRLAITLPPEKDHQLTQAWKKHKE